MIEYKSLEDFGKTTKCPSFYMMIGHGSRNQFARLTDLKKALVKVSKGIEKGSCMLYFGDYPDKKKPDIGYAHKLLSEMRPDIHFLMIQIKEAESWGVPDFVRSVYWHDDYSKTGDCKWGGFSPSGKPCSNTAKWVLFHNKIKPINRIFMLGGGPIAKKEGMYARKIGIPLTKMNIQRRFLGDGKTRARKTSVRKTRRVKTYYK